MKKQSLFKSKEEIVSMFVGLVIVVAAAALVINIVSSKKGSISLPGVTDQLNLNETNLSSNDQMSEPTGTSTGVNASVYVVKKGDYLSKIAKEKLGSGQRWTELAELNNLKNPSVLLVGQEIKLPASEAVTTTIAQGSYYKVVKGDSLWKISVKTYGDGFGWVNVWQANKSKLINPGLLEIGMELQLPKLN